MVSLNPVRILAENAEEQKRETARFSGFAAAIAIGDLVKSTLGPKGMDKILLSSGRCSGQVQITNDGATILKSVSVDNPAAKILIDLSKVQDKDVGDGTTSVAVFASELLKEGKHLIEAKLHPQTIISGWRKATEVAIEALTESAIDIRMDDSEGFWNDLKNVAKTTLSSKILSLHMDHFASLAVNAFIRLNGSEDLDNIQIIKKVGGTLKDSFLDEGFLLDKKPGVFQPKRVENARVLLANIAMDADRPKVFGSNACVKSIAGMADMEGAEKQYMREKISQILKHKPNVFINRQLIYNYPEQLFADAGVMAIQHADFEGIERLALVTGAEITSNFDTDIKLGSCELVEQVEIGGDTLLRFSGVPESEACSVVIRGATQQILDEAARSLHDALCVLLATLRENKFVYGGGCSETIMAIAIRNKAALTSNKEALAMESYANALLRLPQIMSDNGGYDSVNLVRQLIAAHSSGADTSGINMEKGAVGDMKDLSIIESYAVKKQMVLSASEAAEMLVRVDNVMKAAPRKANLNRGHC
ncbi:T-complex protein 1 subunit beta-like [Aethina tumida]|uniref:T-complex protein 1 subunit beta-like n=1 Tax=Aethina tumida TaxID=116153 RepID=UPI0021483FBE|nr:T-complex protein 1 subunit beta-like [Aethina tumida]